MKGFFGRPTAQVGKLEDHFSSFQMGLIQVKSCPLIALLTRLFQSRFTELASLVWTTSDW